MALRANLYFVKNRSKLHTERISSDIQVKISMRNPYKGFYTKESLCCKRLCQFCEGAPRRSGCAQMKKFNFTFMPFLYLFYVERALISHRLRTIKKTIEILQILFKLYPDEIDNTLWTMRRSQRACAEPSALASSGHSI